jgi:amyloid beta precursor protein binding protein 1
LGRPLTRKDDLKAFKAKITSMSTDVHKEENFQEALREAHRYFMKPELRFELVEVMNALRDAQSSGESFTGADPLHAHLVLSLGEYLESHDQLPPLETVPDMHSTSEYFLQLQEVFRRKAQQEFDDFKAIVVRRLQVSLSLSLSPSLHLSPQCSYFILKLIAISVRYVYFY